ncbi:uncharacterized protein CTHT_0010070 [Thermochaetoides thermophila DSM 1495]|uniref:Uncharacterized protein n=1 Tax=Chaetomium thermophilum (strain DSM 1495 / CBS 144.50 / IMI 039719) TaxID=759272 RepID=G0S0H8_CHATD|nr:hypothetical protein CTHT_0010070 [Thermochaetoides thermophila DSM 1495]EGS23339.1 hypothetical protein CTHT_0010070 [Thermochaetoides thermophila DSM 1495]
MAPVIMERSTFCADFKLLARALKAQRSRQRKRRADRPAACSARMSASTGIVKSSACVGSKVSRLSRSQRLQKDQQEKKKWVAVGDAAGPQHDSVLYPPAFAAAAMMLAFIPLSKPLGLLQSRATATTPEYLLNPYQSLQTGLRGASVESILARDRDCSFRTRLKDVISDSDSETFFEDMSDDEQDLQFDDQGCVEVNRAIGKFAAVSRLQQSHKAQDNQQSEVESDQLLVSKPLNPNLFAPPVNDQASVDYDSNSDISDSSSTSKHIGDVPQMESLTLPFYFPSKRAKYTPIDPTDVPDDMSIISDADMVPTYAPNVKKQHGFGRLPANLKLANKALLKRALVSKARAAKKTMKQFKRTCREAMGCVFDPACTVASPADGPLGEHQVMMSRNATKGTKCASVGSRSERR